jgi:hypothetical protein
MKKKTVKTLYDDAIWWIAHNDEPNERNLLVLEQMVTVYLIADTFDKCPGEVAKDVLAQKPASIE